MEREKALGQRYQLVISGELGERFAYLFEGMRMEHEAGRTILTGTVRDQAELHGMFDRIAELGLELVSVQRTPDAA